MQHWIRVGLALALLAWSAAGGLALYELQRARPEDPRIEEARREAALLRDRLELVSADTVALAGALERGFETFAAVLEERSAADERSVQDLASRLDSLADDVRRLAVPAPQGEPVPLPALVEVEAVPAPAPMPEPAVEPARARSFLAFALPSQEQGFEGARTYEILGDLSRVGFDAKSTLHDFTGTSAHVRGSLVVDLARPADGIAGAIEIDVQSLSTSNEARDEAMREHLEAARFERVRFTPSAFAVAAVDTEARTVTGSVRGRLALHGIEREVALDVRGHVDDARRLVVEGELTLALPDYGIEVPSKLGLISMEPQVRVWIHLRARPRLGEGRP